MPGVPFSNQIIQQMCAHFCLNPLQNLIPARDPETTKINSPQYTYEQEDNGQSQCVMCSKSLKHEMSSQSKQTTFHCKHCDFEQEINDKMRCVCCERLQTSAAEDTWDFDDDFDSEYHNNNEQNIETQTDEDDKEAKQMILEHEITKGLSDDDIQIIPNKMDTPKQIKENKMFQKVMDTYCAVYNVLPSHYHN
eukprot:129396_1